MLLIGILIALFMRGIFIGVGAAALARFEWLFYLFGAFLIWTASGCCAAPDGDDEDFKENILLRWVQRVMPATDEYDGTEHDGRASTAGASSRRCSSS